MNRPKIDKLIADIRSDYTERQETAIEMLNREAGEEDLPVLADLLADVDDEVREAVAVPYARIVGPRSIERLLAVFQRGLEEGLDCERLQEALGKMVNAHRMEAQTILETLATGTDPTMRANAAWLLERSRRIVVDTPFADAEGIQLRSIGYDRTLRVVVEAFPSGKSFCVVFADPQASQHIRGDFHKKLADFRSSLITVPNSRWSRTLCDDAHMHPHPNPDDTLHYQLATLGDTIDVLSSKPPVFEEVNK